MEVEWIPEGDLVPEVEGDPRSPVAALGSVDDEDMREVVLQLLIDASDQVFGFSARAPSAFGCAMGSGIRLVQTGAARWMILADRR